MKLTYGSFLSALKFGVTVLFQNIGKFFLLFLAMIGLSVASILILAMPVALVIYFYGLSIKWLLYTSLALTAILFSLSMIALWSFFRAITIKIGLKSYENQPIYLRDFFQFNLRQYIKFISTYMLYMLSIFIGMIFLIIPGIYLFIRYIFAEFVIVDKNTDTKKSFKESSVLTKNVKLKLFFTVIVLVLALLVIFVPINLLISSFSTKYMSMIFAQGLNNINFSAVGLTLFFNFISSTIHFFVLTIFTLSIVLIYKKLKEDKNIVSKDKAVEFDNLNLSE